MQTTKPNTSSIAIKWAVIYLITAVVITYAFQFLGMPPESPLRYVSYLFFIAFLMLAQKEYKDQAGGFMTFGNGFVEGLIYSVYCGILLAVFLFVYLKFLSPDVLEQSIASQRGKLEAQGNLSADQVDTAMQISSKYGALIGAVGTLFVMPIIGCIVALIGAAILKKEPSITDIEKDSTTYIDPVV